MTDDLTRSERLNLASRVFYDFRQQAGDMDPPAYEYLSDQDLMTALLGDLRHYADWRGIDFDRAIAAGNAAYYQRRDEEEYPYSLGEEVEYLQRDSIQHYAGEDTPVAPRGIIASIYPERNGALTYHVRFLGEADTRSLQSEDLQPAPPFPRTATHQGPLDSLAEAERVFVETSARIRSCQLRHAPPTDNDITDQDTISAALARTCGLDAPDILRLLEPQVAAWTAETTRPWRPVPASHPAQVSALDFPQPAQPVTEPPGQTPGLGPRTAPQQRSHGPKPG
jgi:hypothetical protein